MAQNPSPSGSKSSTESKWHGKLDAKQVSGRFKAMCQPEEWRVCFKHEKSSGTEKVPGGRERKKGCEKKLFFPNSLKR